MYAGLQQRHMGAAVGGPAAVLAPAAPGGMFRMRRAPGMQMRMIRIDIKALVQMAVVALVMYQVRLHASPVCLHLHAIYQSVLGQKG